jgi:hypothetical protein
MLESGALEDIQSQRSHETSEVLRGFNQSLYANAGIVPEIMLRPLPSISFPFHYLLIASLFDAI